MSYLRHICARWHINTGVSGCPRFLTRFNKCYCWLFSGTSATCSWTPYSLPNLRREEKPWCQSWEPSWEIQNNRRWITEHLVITRIDRHESRITFTATFTEIHPKLCPSRQRMQERRTLCRMMQMTKLRVPGTKKS